MQKSHSPSGIGTIADASTAIRMIDALGGVSVVGEDQAEALAAELKEGHYQPGEAVVNEAELSNRLYLILKGRAEVTARGHKGPIPLATVEAGQVFGELGLLGRHNRRTATVRAITELATLELPGVAFQRFLDGQPEIRKALSERVIETSRSDFLRRATPFSALESAQRRQLASRMEESEIPAGGTIVRQGEQGDSCFLLMEGHAEVLLEDGVNQRSLGKLTEGTLFGEGALLGGETTRSATVRALTDCRLLVLERRDLLSVLGTQEKLASDIARLIKLRERARRQDGIEVYERAGPDGELITILKDPNRFTYFRLSPQGRFVWDRLDGRQNVRDLTVAYHEATGTFAPYAIAEVVAELARSGFAESPGLSPELAERLDRSRPWERWAAAARRVLEWQISLRGVDPLISRVYRKVVRHFYTPVGQLALAIVVVAGLISFVEAMPRATNVLTSNEGAVLYLFLVPAYFFYYIVHEGGHAFTTKHYGRQINRIGVGWYWFGPMAFVDTSDMWLADRKPRIVVSLAGPYATLVLAGLAGMIALWSASDAMVATTWQFALVSYIGVFVNLNPLLELDGYYVLIDLLDRPNLRPKALRWLGQRLPQAWRDRAELRAHRTELLYGVLAVAYIPVAAVLTAVFYRQLAERWLARLFDQDVASWLAWVLAGATVALSIIAILGELRGHREPAGSL